MKLVLSNGIFYEFVPSQRKIIFSQPVRSNPEAETFTIDGVEEGNGVCVTVVSPVRAKERYLIGDAIKFLFLSEEA